MQILSYRRWSSALLLFILSIVGAVVAVNCAIDPYAILRTDLSHQYTEPNQRYLKIKHLLADKDRYDSFVFGSSRALQIDNRKLRDGIYYNMGTSEGVPQEHLQHIEFLMKNGVKVRHLIIALDDFSCRILPEQHLTDLLRQPHYLVSGKPRLNFYAEYFVKMRRFFPTIRDHWRATHTEAGKLEARRFFFDMYGTGRVFCRTCDDEINRDVEKYIKDPKFERPILHYTLNNLDSTIGSLRSLVQLARTNGIGLTILMNPVHRTSYLDTDLPLFFEFKRRLADITDYYDFSGLNSITTNNYYYHETSHYREIVGDMMLARMFGYPRVDVPRDFGVLVTRATVEDHLRKQQAELDDWRKDHAGADK